jgi:hypothetical protein
MAQDQVLHGKLVVNIGTDRDRKTGALRALLAKADGHVLTYAGAAFIGLRGDAWHELRERLQQMAIPRSPLTWITVEGRAMGRANSHC